MSSIITRTNSAAIAMIHIVDMGNDCFISGFEVGPGETVGLGVSEGAAAETEIGLFVITRA